MKWDRMYQLEVMCLMLKKGIGKVWEGREDVLNI